MKQPTLFHRLFVWQKIVQEQRWLFAEIKKEKGRTKERKNGEICLLFRRTKKSFIIWNEKGFIVNVVN